MVIEKIFATYSYEEIFLFRWRHYGERGSWVDDGDIICICPICNYGFNVVGQEAAEVKKKKIAKKQGGAEAAAFAIDNERQLAALQSRINVSMTTQYVSSLNLFKRRTYKKMLYRLGLNQLLSILNI